MFLTTGHVLTNVVRVVEENDPEGKRKLLRVRGSSYGGFELPRVKLQ